MAEPTTAAAPVSEEEAAVLKRITEIGDSIRTLKSSGGDKGQIAEKVQSLLAAKAEYKTLTGKDWAPPSSSSSKKDKKKKEGGGGVAVDGGEKKEKSKSQLKKEQKAAEKEAKKKEKAQAEQQSKASSNKKNSSSGSSNNNSNNNKAKEEKKEDKPAAFVRALSSRLPLPTDGPELRFGFTCLPLEAFAVSQLLRSSSSESKKEKLTLQPVPTPAMVPQLIFPSGEVLHGSAVICRYLALSHRDLGLAGHDTLASCSIDHWVDFAQYIRSDRPGALSVLEKVLEFQTFLVGHSLTLADIFVWAALTERVFAGDAKLPHVSRWYAHLSALPPFLTLSEDLENVVEGAKKGGKKKGAKGEDGKKTGKGSAEGKDGARESKSSGKCPPLEGAEEGKVVTRFPPEPSGYLHVGHVKAAMLNDYYARRYNGTLLLRFDDTNPSKEKQEFEDSIIEDLATLKIKADKKSHTSDHFPMLYDYALKMLSIGKAYMDNTPVEKMREERAEGIESDKRSTEPEENLRIFKAMCEGQEEYLGYCMRGKIDMKNPNKALRDPVFYRSNLTPHPRTGTQYKAYPTYDFACPIVDSVEGVTHALRTTEYNDRDAQYQWVLKTLGLRPVKIVAFARMNFVHTVLSKRKLTWFVESGEVQGWDDPRLPTVRGTMRRGVNVEALREFILGEGFSRRVTNMEWDKFWSLNKAFVDPSAPRAMAVDKDTAVELRLKDVEDSAEPLTTPIHPKDASFGTRKIEISSCVLLEGSDAEAIEDGEEVTLMRWGNVIIEKVVKDEQGKVKYLEGKTNLQGNVKTTKKKLTWLAKTSNVVEAIVEEYDYIINKAKLEEDDDFMDYINRPSKAETRILADSFVISLKQDQILQFERKGFYRVEKMCSKEGELPVFIVVPDGKQKSMSGLKGKLAHR